MSAVVLPNPPAGRARSPEPSLHPRLQVVIGIERTFLVARYIAYAALIGYYLLGDNPQAIPNILIITLGAIVHNTFVHWVLFRREYEWFLSPVNFFIHLAKVSLLVVVTGGEDSLVALFYLAVIIGYCIYSPRFTGTFRVTLAACLAYTLALLLHWAMEGIGVRQTPVAAHYASIIICGWLMSRMGRMMRKMEVELQNRAGALASSEATLRAILDSTPSPIVVYEENEFISHVNDRACEFLGASREQLLGCRFRTFLFDDGTLPNKLGTLRSKGEYFGEVLVIIEDGSERNVHLVARSFVSETKRLFVALMLDITEQKNLQEAQRLATLQLEQINRELQRVHDLRTAFFASVSQRLRSPMSAILGQIDLLLDEELGPLTNGQQRALQSSRRSATRVFDLLDEAFEVEGIRHHAVPPTERPEKDPANF